MASKSIPALIYEVDLMATLGTRRITKFPVFPICGMGQHMLMVETESANDVWKKQAEWTVLITPLPESSPPNK